MLTPAGKFLATLCRALLGVVGITWEATKTMVDLPMVQVRRGADRGTTAAGWLQSRHSFSFGGYRDPANTHYRSLRVINDDVIAPAGGFPEHGHENMEILTWVLEGALKHGDSLGHQQVLHPGELQAMSAGTGITHSEMNASDTEPVRLVQIWLIPKRKDIEPRYGQRAFDAAARRNRWDTLASGLGHPTAMPINQDAELRVTDLDAGATVSVSLSAGRYGYLHVTSGRVALASEQLNDGDAASLPGPAEAAVTADTASQVLFFALS